MSNQIRQNYHQEAENAVNQQVNVCLNASYTYLSLSFYFDRDDVALPNFKKFFKKLSEQKQEQAEKLMNLQSERGGRLIFQTVNKPLKDSWGTGLEAVTAALELEKSLNQAFMGLHAIAESSHDAHLEDLIEEEFLEKQVEYIKCLANHVTNLKRVGSGLGEYLFDRETFE